MTQKSHFEHYAIVTAYMAKIVNSWPEAQALTSGKHRGKARGAKTYSEAEILLNKLIAERNQAMSFEHRK